MIRNLKVEPVYFRREIVGYSVGGIIRDCPDSLWDPIIHNAIFRTQERAERFLAKIRAGRINWAHWRVGPSWDGAYSVL